MFVFAVSPINALYMHYLRYVQSQPALWLCQKLCESSQRFLIKDNKAKYLLEKEHFDYVLPAINADECLEKFFGCVPMRNDEGKFYIDIIGVQLQAAAVFNLHSLRKNDVIPSKDPDDQTHVTCDSRSVSPDEDDIDKIHELTPADRLFSILTIRFDTKLFILLVI